MSQGRYLYIPIDVAQTPREGHAYVNRYWLVHPEKGVAFWYQPFGYDRSDEPSPQCNSSEQTAEYLNRNKTDEGFEVQFIPVVFAAHAMMQMRKEKQELLQQNRKVKSQ